MSAPLGDVRKIKKKKKKAAAALPPKKGNSKKKETACKVEAKSDMANGAYKYNGADASIERLDEEEDYSDDGDEGEDGYREGGYHPVHVGDKFHNSRYTVIEKMGWGHFSTVWMAYDKKWAEGNPAFVALKIQKSAPHYREAALDEIELLRCAARTSESEAVQKEYGGGFECPIVLLMDYFDHLGPNGKHVCFTFELLGENLLKVIKKYDYRGVPVDIVRRFAKDICVGLDFLHRHCEIIHTDLKPENILITRNPQLPSMADVRRIIDAGPCPGVKTAAKKKTKGTSSSNQPTLVYSIEAVSKQLEGSKGMSSDQKKKLKKKLKKKRQQLSKKVTSERGEGKGKRGLTSRRQEHLEGGVLDDDRLVKEMIAMELASLPSGQLQVTMEGSVIKISDDDNISIDSDDELKAEYDVLHSHSRKVSSLLSSDTHREVEENAKGHGSSIASSIDCARDHTNGVHHMHYDGDTVHELMSWMRPTLFALINLMPNDHGVSDNATDQSLLLYDGVRTLSARNFREPSKELYSKISMIATVGKLLKAFGPPSSHTSNSDPALEAESKSGVGGMQETGKYTKKQDLPHWHLKLMTKRFEIMSRTFGDDDGGSADEEAEVSIREDEACRQFSISALGEDSCDIGALSMRCLLVGVSDRPLSYSAIGDGEQPTVWEIVFSASHTEHILAYLESAVPGLRFLVHYGAPRTIAEEDDAELLYYMRGLCIHPACRDTGKAIDRSNNISLDHHRSCNYDSTGMSPAGEEFAAFSFRDCDNSRFSSSEDMDRLSHFGGGGAIIGVDLDTFFLAHAAYAASRSMNDEDEFEYSQSFRLCAFVKPLRWRLRVFEASPAEVRSLSSDYLSLYRSVQALQGSMDSLAGSESVITDLDCDEEAAGCRDDDSLIDDHDDARSQTATTGAKVAVKRDTRELDAYYQTVSVKIVDLGNACWIHKHFTDDIQTRQYRSPEVLLGAEYDTSADMWSLACVIFELLTGDLLFDPQEGKTWDREEDHLAMMVELVGAFPRSVYAKGQHASQYFDRKGELRNIKNLKFWGLKDVLREKYKFSETDAEDISSFLLPMLEVDPSIRATARECWQHPWLHDLGWPAARAQSHDGHRTRGEGKDGSGVGR